MKNKKRKFSQTIEIDFVNVELMSLSDGLYIEAVWLSTCNLISWCYFMINFQCQMTPLIIYLCQFNWIK